MCLAIPLSVVKITFLSVDLVIVITEYLKCLNFLYIDYSVVSFICTKLALPGFPFCKCIMVLYTYLNATTLDRKSPRSGNIDR